MRIRKFNESKEQFSQKIIEEIFIKFFDNDLYDATFSDTTELTLFLDTPFLKVNNSYDIKKMVSHSEEVRNFFLDIESCIEKVKMSFPEIEIDILLDRYGPRIINEYNIGRDYIGISFL